MTAFFYSDDYQELKCPSPINTNKIQGIKTFRHLQGRVGAEPLANNH